MLENPLALLLAMMLAPFLIFHEEAYCSDYFARYDTLEKNDMFSNMVSAHTWDIQIVSDIEDCQIQIGC